MARIDRVLSIVSDQGANELRIGTDREPKMLAYGTVKKLSIPSTSEEMLRDLLGEILTPEREEAMRARGRVEVVYEAGPLGTFQVSLTSRSDNGFDAIFRKSSARAPAAAPEPAESARAIPLAHVAPLAPLAHDLSAASVGQVAPYPTADSDLVASPMLAELVAHAAQRRASDLHLCDGEPATIRIDGKLLRLDDAPIDLAAMLAFPPALEAR